MTPACIFNRISPEPCRQKNEMNNSLIGKKYMYADTRREAGMGQVVIKRGKQSGNHDKT